MRRILATTPEANLARLPIALDLRALSIGEGMRAALSIAVIVAADQWLQWPPLLEAALGALLTCLGDSGGPIRLRLPSLLTFAAVGSMFTLLGGPVRAAGLEVSLPLACLCVFGCTFARVWGQNWQQAGNLLLVVLVLSLDRPSGFPAALERGGLFAAGCAWAVLLTMVIWRIYPFRPARRAVAEIYRTIARLTADLRTLVETDAEAARWDAHARGHRRAVRDRVELGRKAVQDTVRVRGQASPRAFQALMRVEAADQLFGVMIAVSDCIEADRDPVFRQAAARLLEQLRLALLVVAEAIAADDPGLSRPDDPAHGKVGRLAAMGGACAELAGLAEPHPALAPLAQAIVERLQMAVMLTAPRAGVPGGMPAGAAADRWIDRFVGPIRANASWQSAILRHAVRAVVMVGPALAITWHLAGGYQHWLTITLVSTLQPFYALTWQRALERCGGTLLGALLAGGLAFVCTTPLTIAAALFPLAIGAFALRGVNYGAFVACLTPMVVLLVEFGEPEMSEWFIAASRAGFTVAGGLLAVAGCIVLWPSWEPDRLRRELRTALVAHASYAEADLGAILGEVPPDDVDRARRAAGVASNNLETSISRALNEPRRGGRSGLQRAMVVDAALRRMAGRLSMLQLDHHHEDGLPPTVLRAWRDWIGGALRALAAGEPSPPRPSEAKIPEALIRIARQIELLDGAVPE